MSIIRTYRIAADLLATLEAESYPLGTGAHLRVQELLRGLPHDDDETLCTALCAILARNPQEQTHVHERFRESAARTDALLEHLKTEEEKAAVLAETETQLRRWGWRTLIPAAFLLLAALAAAWFFWKEKTAPVVIEKLMIVQAGESRMVCASEIEGLKDFGNVKATQVTYPTVLGLPLLPNWDRANAKGRAIAPDSMTALGSFLLNADTCFIYTARDSVEGLDSIAVQFDFVSGKNATVAFKVLVEKPESETVKAPQLPGRDTLFKPKNIPYPHDITECAIQPPPVWQSFLAEHLWWLRWAFFVPFTLFLFALWRWLEFRRRKLIAQMERRDQPPYFWNIRIPGADDIVLGDSFAFALQVMRRRAASDVMRLDLSKTIEKTAERGGMPDFRYRQLTRPVDYLLLIERGDPANHRAQLFDALYRAFRAQEIEIARFWYDGDVRLCFDEQNPKGVHLPELANRFPGARLLVLGNGTQFLSPDSGKPMPWTDTFNAWKERALLTPKPTGDWGLDERRLATLFTVLPATLQGLGFWVDELDVGQDAHFEDWQKHVKDAPQSIFQPNADDPLPALMLQFDPQMLRWVAACAIYSSLHWDLTLWLGRQLAVGSEQSAANDSHSKLSKLSQPSKPSQLSKPSKPAASDEEGLVTVENLLRLFRLRWFVDGEMPTNARAALLDWLERNDPVLLARLRTSLADLLRQNPPPQNSAAFDDYALNIALNEWLAAQDPARKKELEAEIARRLEAGAKPDFTVLKYLERPRSALDFVVPDAWKKYVYPGGYRALGWKGRWKDLLWALPIWLVAAVGVFWPYDLKVEECTGAKAEIVENGTKLTLCLNSPRCMDIYLEYLVKRDARVAPVSKMDSIVNGYLTEVSVKTDNGPQKLARDAMYQYPQETVTNTFYIEAYANIATELYNRALTYAATQKDSACILFRLAAQLDSLDYDYQRAVAWCGDGDKKPLPEIKGRFETDPFPEAGVPFAFLLFEYTPGAVYELDPGDGTRRAFNNDRPIPKIPYTYERAGSYQVTLYARYEGQLLRLQTAAVVVANKANVPATPPVIDDFEKPVDTPSQTTPPVVTVSTEGLVGDTTGGLPPGRYVLTGSNDGTVKLWTMEGQEKRTFIVDKVGISDADRGRRIDISPDGKYFAASTQNNTIVIFDLRSNQAIKSLASSSKSLTLAYSPNGRYLGSGTEDGSVLIWDVENENVYKTFKVGERRITCVSFSSNGQLLAAVNDDRLAVWDIRDGSLVLEHTDFRELNSFVKSVDFTPNGLFLAVGGGGYGHILIFDLQKSTLHSELENRDEDAAIAYGLDFSHDGLQLATLSGNFSCTIWDWQKSQILHTLKGHTNYLRSVQLSPDDRYVLTGSSDNTAKLWTLDGKLIHTYSGHTDDIWSVAFLWVK